MNEPHHRSRRQVLGLVGGAAAAALAGGVVGWRVSRTGEPVAIPGHAMQSPSTVPVDPVAPGVGDEQDLVTTTTEAIPVDEGPYELVDDEVFGAAKLVGVRIVEALMGFGADESIDEVVDRSLRFGTPELTGSTLAEAGRHLFVPGADSRPRVVYPQLGGLDPHSDPTSGSIMVVVEQHLNRDGVDVVVSRCVDVRVVRTSDDDWLVSGIEDTSGEPVAPPGELSDEARRVLDHDDIDLPDSVRWDIYDNIVDRRVLVAMADLADDTPIRVTTCKRGHPINVFGTPGRSAHTVGRAVDIWSVDDTPVVQQRHDTDSVAHRVARRLYEGGQVHRLGSPWSFGAGSWTDPVHQDHLHLGVNA